jgi:hypothetical protein
MSPLKGKWRFQPKRLPITTLKVDANEDAVAPVGATHAAGLLRLDALKLCQSGLLLLGSRRSQGKAREDKEKNGRKLHFVGG